MPRYQNDQDWHSALLSAEKSEQEQAHAELVTVLRVYATRLLRRKQPHVPLLTSRSASELDDLGEDFAQTIHQALYKQNCHALRQFKFGCPFHAWLLLITKRAINKELGKQVWQKEVRSPASDADGDSTSERSTPPVAGQTKDDPTLAAVEATALLDQLAECLEKLTASERQFFTRRFVDGLSAEEVAEETGKSINAINLAVFKAKPKLLACLQMAGYTKDDIVLFITRAKL